MGFGDLAAVKTLRDAGIVVNSTPGLRTGLMIVDHHGYITMHASGGYLSFTQAGADLFA